jgi:hypothetical protein
LNARTFARRFQAATGYRPMHYFHALQTRQPGYSITSLEKGIRVPSTVPWVSLAALV